MINKILKCFYNRIKISAVERYDLVFRYIDGRASINIEGNQKRVFSSLVYINEFHIGEFEMIVMEIENAQNGFSYDHNFLFDWADPDLELEAPNVKFYDLVIGMDDFKDILKDWIEFNKNSVLDVKKSFKY